MNFVLIFSCVYTDRLVTDLRPRGDSVVKTTRVVLGTL